MRRALAYLWASPNTALGLVIGLLAGARPRVVEGVVELSGGALRFLLRRCVPIPGGASAVTLGHAVLGRDRAALDRTRAHERVHVRQCERWGPLFLPAYFACALAALARGRDAYRDNPFEKEAFRAG